MEADILDIMGPLPSDNSCIIFLKAKQKIFSVRCSFLEATICSLSKANRQLYSKECDISLKNDCDSVLKIEKTQISFANDDYLSRVFFLDGEHKVKIVRLGAMTAINSSLLGNVPLYLTNEFYSKSSDFSYEYKELKYQIGNLWVLPKVTHTDGLKALCDFSDKLEQINA